LEHPCINGRMLMSLTHTIQMCELELCDSGERKVTMFFLAVSFNL
jgi:hypothetical protein